MDTHAYYYLFYRVDSARIAMYKLIGITRGIVQNYLHTGVCPRLLVIHTVSLFMLDIGLVACANYPPAYLLFLGTKAIANISL